MPELSEHKELIADFFGILEKHAEEFKDLPEWSAYNIFCYAADVCTCGDRERAKQFARDYLKMKYKEDKTAFNGPGFIE